jgi:hypothetical protein
MTYVHKEDVIFKYGVELVGWTPDKWCNPSELTTSLPVLRTLLNAIKDGSCKFVRIPPTELKARKAKYEQVLAAGLITGKQRKRRSDIGQKCKRTAADDGEEDESDNEDDDGTTADGAAVLANAATPTANAPTANAPTANTPTSTATPYSVEEPQEPSTLPARKRRKTAKEAAPAKKVPAAKSTTTRPKPRAKGKAANKENRCDDVTRAAIARLKVGNAPGSAGGRAFKSHAVIDNDEDDAPSADASGNASIVSDSHAAATVPAAAAA